MKKSAYEEIQREELTYEQVQRVKYELWSTTVDAQFEEALEALRQAGEARETYYEAQKFTYARTWNKEEKAFSSPAGVARGRLAQLGRVCKWAVRERS
jgi:hypothetical protein